MNGRHQKRLHPTASLLPTTIMGVPGLYTWIFRNKLGHHKPVTPKDMPKAKNVYVDMNSIIHPACRLNGEASLASEQDMFENIAREVDYIVNLTKPNELLFLAVDGVAPSGKFFLFFRQC